MRRDGVLHLLAEHRDELNHAGVRTLACFGSLARDEARPDSDVEDEKTFDAVVRNLEIMGEAAKHVPPEVRARYPGVQWRNIAGLRDIVVHEYFGIDEDILWDIVVNQAPQLLLQVRQILREEGYGE